MGSLTNIGSYKSSDGECRNQVDEYFRDHSTYWRDVYQAETLSAYLYRERRSSVLAMVDKLGLPRRSNVLEAGCGAGWTTVALAKRGLMVTAIDTVEDMLGFTCQAAAEAGVGASVKTSLGDARQLSFPSQRFNLVVAMGVLPWLEDPENALVEMSRVTGPGGSIILTVDNHWCLTQMLDPLCFPGLRTTRWKIAELLEKFDARIPSKPRLHRHSIRHIDKLLQHAGLQKLEWKTLGFGPFTCFKQKLFSDSVGIKVHRKLQSLAGRGLPGIRSLGTEYIVMAKKL